MRKPVYKAEVLWEYRSGRVSGRMMLIGRYPSLVLRIIVGSSGALLVLKCGVFPGVHLLLLEQHQLFFSSLFSFYFLHFFDSISSIYHIEPRHLLPMPSLSTFFACQVDVRSGLVEYSSYGPQGFVKYTNAFSLSSTFFGPYEGWFYRKLALKERCPMKQKSNCATSYDPCSFRLRHNEKDLGPQTLLSNPI